MIKLDSALITSEGYELNKDAINLKLLYKGSLHGFNCAKTEHDIIIGGYTSL